jgi:hypothetical protein
MEASVEVGSPCFSMRMAFGAWAKGWNRLIIQRCAMHILADRIGSQRTFVSLTLALALPSPFGLANLNALALSPGALRSRLRSVRVFAPALIPHAGKEQDLSCAAVARSHTTGTFRGPERDDIIHGGPSRIGRSL